MSKFKLLPRWYRFLGLTLIIPSIVIFCINPDVAFGDMSIFNTSEGLLVTEVPDFFNQQISGDSNEGGITWVKNDLSNELLLMFMLLGTYFVAFARIKGEDEFSEQLRLQSMVSAILWNAVILLVLNFLVYDGMFLYIMISQLFSFLLLFSFIFALKINQQRKALQYEE